MYSSKVRYLLQELPNRGVCVNFTHAGKAENTACRDMVQFQFRAENEVVVDCSFQAYGCPGTLAAAAGLTQLVKSQGVQDCREITLDVLLDFLGGLPRHKEHGAEVALAALRAALEV
jgi:NifU-like protein involved in Fe-S cluster formation